MAKKISILCPVFNEEAVVPLLYQRLKPVISSLKVKYKVDLVFWTTHLKMELTIRFSKSRKTGHRHIRRLFYRILRAFADEEIILDMAEFALFTNEVREAQAKFYSQSS